MAKRLLVKVNEADNVAIAVKEIKAGTQVSEDLVTRQDIPQAHKVALERIPKGQPVIRYGVILGYALEDIEKGDWINEFMLELPTPPSVDDMEYGKKIVTDPPTPHRWLSTHSKDIGIQMVDMQEREIFLESAQRFSV